MADMKRLIIMALFCASAASADEVQVTISDFVREQVGLYDASGAFLRKVPVKQLKGKGGGIKAIEAADGRIRIEVADDSGKKMPVFLRAADVITTGGRPRCMAVAQVQRSATEQIAASNVGVVAGMSAASAPCIRVP
jgi:hypothetical protein